MKNSLSEKTYRVRRGVFHWFVGLGDTSLFALVNLAALIVQVISLVPLLMFLAASVNAWWPIVPTMGVWHALQMSFWLTLIVWTLSWSRRAFTPSSTTSDK